MYQRVSFLTEDKVKITGDYYLAENPVGYVLLLHMMPAVKESWQALAKALRTAGFNVLAFDFRGHGESIYKEEGTVLNYQNFSDQEHQAKILDVRAAVGFLKEQGAVESKMALVGASIGANLALQLLSESLVPTAVLLSPGLDYRGVKADFFEKKLKPEQSFLCVAALDDKYSYDTCIKLTAEIGVENEKILLDSGGHGTDMFNAEPGLIGKIVEWVKGKLEV